MLFTFAPMVGSKSSQCVQRFSQVVWRDLLMFLAGKFEHLFPEVTQEGLPACPLQKECVTNTWPCCCNCLYRTLGTGIARTRTKSPPLYTKYSSWQEPPNGLPRSRSLKRMDLLSISNTAKRQGTP